LLTTLNKFASEQAIRDYVADLEVFDTSPIAASCQLTGFQSVPKRTLIFYGIPQLVNGSNGNVETAAAVFNQFDLVVFGAGIANPSSQWYEGFVQLVDLLTVPEVFGYIATGTIVPETTLNLIDIQESVSQWKAIPKISGILLDEFGDDFGNDATRRADILAIVRNEQLGSILNAFNPEDLFSGPGAIDLGPDEYYLYESFGVQDDQEITNGVNMRIKGRKLTFLANANLLGNTIATTTSLSVDVLDTNLYTYLVEWSARANIYGFSFAYPNFGATDS
jgi:hypothetical protein